MTEDQREYRVGNRKPPLHSRFRKGQSGNPEGARLHRRRDRRLAALIEAALDRRLAARPRQPATRREAIVAALVEKSAAGDLRATKLLLDLIQKSELAQGPRPGPEPEPGGEDPREILIREIDRLAAEEEEREAIARLTRDESVCG